MSNSLVNDYRSMSSDERKLIYVVNVNDDNGDWKVYDNSLKIGDATINDLNLNLSNNSEDLRKAANKRISSYLVTSGIPYNIDWAELAYRKCFSPQWFRDYDVHKVLKRSGIKHNPKLSNGREWYMTDVETVKKAIFAVKNGELAINVPEDKEQIELRPEQKEAVKKTKIAFKKYNRFLWNAKMRFGKTLTAFQLVREEHYQKVLIITHRPVVSDGWFDDFRKIDLADDGYEFGSNNNKGKNLSNLNSSGNPFVYFASIQDLAGSKVFGGKISDKNRLVADIDWDLIIIDEAHEGTQTDLSQRIIDVTTKENTKLLELSGTPFNILDQYADDQVFTWDYVMEQEAKNNWSKEHQDQDNPYAGLPKVSMFTFEMKDKFKEAAFEDVYKQSFNFKEFFRVDDDDNFVYKDKVSKFLDNITSPSSRTNYPFSTRTFRNNLRHTLWILPGVKEARALKKLMDQHPIFGSEYNVVNVVDNGDDTVASDSDLDRVRKAISDKPYNTKTITLTVRKLTTGVTVKEWSGVVFLSNTNSPMQYLQAAFRAQTPYSDITGSKTNCYIFDFAPDRALTIMAGTSDVSNKAGRITTNGQKDNLKNLLNFLPIIGEDNQGMKPFNIDTLLFKMKRVYAEKAVRSGFDDDSIYNDELLLKLNDNDLTAFNKLKAIVGENASSRKPIKIDINKQGLTQTEYDKAIKAQDKKKKERTPEEQAYIDKMNSLKKQKKTMVSILRAISIRIPLMIYGLDIAVNKDVSIKTFVNSIDDASWEEFMPSGVDKRMFKDFEKYYDPNVFIEAGRIIRKKVIEIDNIDPIERANKLADIFNTFKNPDKETVLTPWRAVNLHLGSTIGGYSFFDKEFDYTTKDGTSAAHWIDTYLTPEVLNSNSHILEINSKTGLYPLYVAISLYYLKLNHLNQSKAGKFSYDDEMRIFQDVLDNNVFIIAKTPMATAIAKRTIAGYKHLNINIKFIENLVSMAKSDVEECSRVVKEEFDNMKFDVIIGNPPYQVKGKGSRDEPIYNSFMDLSYELADIVTLITPARFLFKAGGTPNTWDEKMLNDDHLKVIKYYPVSDSIFPRTDIKGGVAITLRDTHQHFGKIGVFTPYPMLNGIAKKVDANGNSLSNIVSSRGTYRFTKIFFDDFPDSINKLGKGSGDMIVTNVFKNIPEAFQDEGGNECIKIIGRLNNKRIFKYIKKKYVQLNDYIDTYNVIIPKSNGRGMLGERLSTPFVAKPYVGSTDTFISIGKFKSEDEAVALLKYIKTKFARVMLGVRKVTQDNAKSAWSEVPMQDFSSNSEINWNSSIEKLDRYFYEKYNLDDDEIKFIESKVQAME